MNTTVRFFLTAIALLSMVNHASADSAREDVEALRAEVVLEASEIDSSTVEVGTFAVVVYGQGERQPTSGAWAKLDTIRGYIKAVDRRRLIVGLDPDGWSKWIALDRIQTLALAGSPSPSSTDQDRTQVDSGRVEGQFQAMPDRISVRTSDMGVGKRLAVKWGAGTLGGILFAGMGLVIGSGMDGHSCDDDFEAGAPFCIPDGAILGMLIGYGAGTAVGVSMWDPHDRFIYSLVGGLLGISAGLALKSPELMFVSPLPMAILASELSRSPLEARRISVGIVPTPKRGLSAVATLRF